MALPMGPSAFAMSGDKLMYIHNRLVGGRNIDRWCIVTFSPLIIPMMVYVSIPDGISMILLSLIGGFMMRNIDVYFLKFFGSSTEISADATTAIPFIFPFVFTIFLGWLYDVVFVIFFIITILKDQSLPPYLPLCVQFSAFIGRTIVIIRLGKSARMIMDPGYVPRDLTFPSTSAPLVRTTVAVVGPTRTPQFQAFSGQGTVLSSSPPAQE
jgi:hypothetical protein